MWISVWTPTIAMLAVSLISYIDRNVLALLAPAILRETGLSAMQYGFIITAFSIAYMVGNPIWGMVLDRAGLRLGMTCTVAFWTVSSAAHAFAGGFVSFAVARAALGFGEGATFPGGLRTAAQTLPPSSRSRGIAVAYSGGSLGAIVTPIIITPLAAAYGWRASFWFTGIIGLSWLAAWALISRGLPKRIAADRHSNASLVRLSDPRLWAFMAAYALGALPLGFVLYGAAIYLTDVRGFTQIDLGKLLWIPPLGWEVGYFFWGWISDRFRNSGRVSFETLFLLTMLLSLPLALTHSFGTTAVMFELFFAMFIAAGFVILPIAYAIGVFSAESSGMIAGAGAGSWSAMVGIMMPVFGRLFDQRRWEEAFVLAALFPAAGYIVWRVLSAKRHHSRPALFVAGGLILALGFLPAFAGLATRLF